jgi:hypothetical protein
MPTNGKALCVGVNVLKNFPHFFLNGCVNDAYIMAALLKDLLGFSDDDIIILTDSQATKAKIMKILRSMVADAKAGKYSYLVFYLSCLGTLMPNTTGKVLFNKDDAFCPYDLTKKGNQWDIDHIIMDHELHDQFVQLPRNVLVEVFFDSCHSGTGPDTSLDFNSTEFPDWGKWARRSRFVNPPSLEKFLSMSDGRRWRGLTRSLADKGRAYNIILWTAGPMGSLSSETKIGGKWHGVFTYYFCKEMRKCKNKLSRIEVLKKVKANLRTYHGGQIPQLEGEPTLVKSKISKL